MTYDLIGKVHIPPAFAALALDDAGRAKLEQVQECFSAYPHVLDWLGALAGVGQPLRGDGASMEYNAGKLELFQQILALLAAADLTEDQARALTSQR